jgi:hypothetical protein
MYKQYVTAILDVSSYVKTLLAVEVLYKFSIHEIFLFTKFVLQGYDCETWIDIQNGTIIYCNYQIPYILIYENGKCTNNMWRPSWMSARHQQNTKNQGNIHINTILPKLMWFLEILFFLFITDILSILSQQILYYR